MVRTFTVKLVRPVLETLVIEVEAWSGNSARQKALDIANERPATDWSVATSDAQDYRPHVASTIDNQDVYETSSNPHEELRTFRSADRMPEGIKYMILAADLENGEGHWLPQPWFENAEPALQVDLCSDLIDALSFIVENDGLDDGEAPATSGCRNNVIDFPAGHLNEEVGQLSM